jgi:hypothetical protein
MPAGLMFSMPRIPVGRAIALWRAAGACLAIALAGLPGPTRAGAQVLVLVNRTTAVVPLELSAGAASRKLTLNAAHCLPVPLSGSGTLALETGQGRKTYPVKSCGIYYVGEVRKGVVDVGEIEIGRRRDPNTNSDRVASYVSEPVLTEIPVKVVYDDAGAVSPQIWQSTLRRRFEAASQVFRRVCFVEFRIVTIDTWRLPIGVTEFAGALAHLERAATNDAESLLVVGFTGKLRTFEGRHTGGTRGPLHTHLLVRERIERNTEKERLEVLVHELGHFLGAVHSPEGSSVMRPMLGNRRTWVAPSGVIFDPLNTLAMCLVSNEVRMKRSVHLFEFSPAGRQKLRDLYTVMAESLPGDDSARHYLELLGPVSGDAGNH